MPQSRLSFRDAGRQPAAPRGDDNRPVARPAGPSRPRRPARGRGGDSPRACRRPERGAAAAASGRRGHVRRRGQARRRLRARCARRHLRGAGARRSRRCRRAGRDRPRLVRQPVRTTCTGASGRSHSSRSSSASAASAAASSAGCDAHRGKQTALCFGGGRNDLAAGIAELGLDPHPFGEAVERTAAVLLAHLCSLPTSLSSIDQRTARIRRWTSRPRLALAPDHPAGRWRTAVLISADSFAASASARSSVNTQRTATAPSPLSIRADRIR